MLYILVKYFNFNIKYIAHSTDLGFLFSLEKGIALGTLRHGPSFLDFFCCVHEELYETTRVTQVKGQHGKSKSIALSSR